MLHLGEKQTLTVIKTVDFGVYLAESQNSSERVLLPKRQVPAGTSLHDTLEVFLYKDSSDRLIATTAQPYIELHGFAALTVSQVTRFGAFLDWGLEKDLFLPYKEQLYKVREGDCILVTLYIDKSNRLCASMKGIYHLLETDSPYQAGDTVSGRVYEISKNFGAFVAVDDRYSALIPASEDHTSLHIGQVIEAKVRHVKPDGKLDLTMRDKAYIQITKDAEHVMEVIDSYAGVLPFTEKASPEIIQRETQLSKNAFKRAVGHLYKEHRITIKDNVIRRIDK